MTVAFDRRHVVLTAVHTVPGSHLRALERISHLPLGTLRYHLGLLVGEGRVDEETDRRFKRFYPSTMRTEGRRIWDALRQQGTRDMVSMLLHAPTSRAQMAASLGIASSTVHVYAARLKVLGIAGETEGRLWLQDPEAVSAILEGVDPTALDLLIDGAVGLFDQLER